MDVVARLLQIAGIVVVLPGLWYTAGGLRVVVSGRIDERRRSASSLKLGLSLLVVGLVLLFGGGWLATWSR